MLTVNEHIQRLKKLAANDKIPSDLRQAFLAEISDLESVIEKPVVDHPLPQFNKKQPKKRDIMDTYLVGKDKQNVRQQKKTEKLHYKNLKRETIKNNGMDFKLIKDHNLFARYSINFKHFNNTFRYAHNDTMEFIKPKLNTLLDTKMEDFKSLKVNVTLTATFIKKSFGEMMVDGVKVELKEDVKVAYLRSKTQVCINKEDVKYAVDDCISELLEKIDEFTNLGSNWVFKHADRIDVGITKYKPMRGGSYIKTPDYVPHRCVINVVNDDEECFKWSILASQFPPEIHPERVNQYKQYENKFNFSGISYPVEIKGIKKFEAQNPTLSINVFGCYADTFQGKQNFEIYPIHISEKYNGIEHDKMIDLLLIEGRHYVWIKNFAGICFRLTKHNAKKYPCRRCLHICYTPERLQSHIKECRGISKAPARVKLPEVNSFCQFYEYGMCMKVPLTIHADLESYNKTTNKQCGERTVQIGEQDANSYCYTMVWRDGRREGPFLYRGDSPVPHFLQELKKLSYRVNKIFANIKPMIMTAEQSITHQAATQCYLCSSGFTPKNKKTAHHDHLNGLYEGPACNNCNLKMRIVPGETKIPVIFHNLRGYDSHLLLTEIGKVTDDLTNISCIPNNMEKYMSFNMGQFQFIDSYQFMQESLDNLAKNLSDDEMVHTKDYFMKKYNEEIYNLMRRKGIYPYEWVNNKEKFEGPELPPKEAFYSRLSRTNITNADYDHAKKVWEKCGCKNFGDYHDLYLITDVMLLTDVFETFRNMSMKNYGIDPAYKFSTAGLSWSAMLKSTQVKLELLSDYDMHLMFEKGIRGGISTVCAKRLMEANNKYCKNFDPKKLTKYLMYLDANNLYGWAMMRKMPDGQFKWITMNLEQALVNIKNTDFDSDYECIYEVDLEYPSELHDLHNDYPLAPQRMKVKKDEYSPWQLEMAEKLGNNLTEYEKLIPNLNNKDHYVVHGQILKLYLELGMKLTKVHRAIHFHQAAWLKPYIEQNTNLRKKSKSDFEKNFFKLMNNAIYGKTMENVRGRVNVELVHANNNERMQKLLNSPNFDYMKTFDNDLVAMHMFKTTVHLVKPIYVGMAILDLSKYLMYNFWYNHIKKIYGNKAQLLYTDTDSFIYEVETEDVYADMKKNDSYYDFSEYPKNHPCYNPVNAKVPGLFKDESCGRPMTAFAGIMSKMYAFTRDPFEDEEVKIINDKEVYVKKDMNVETMSEKDLKGLSSDAARKHTVKKIKGVGTVVVNMDVGYEMYKDCILNGTEYSFSQTVLRSKSHKIGVYEQTKKALSPLDTKRYILDNGIDTLAFGHYKIKEAALQAVDDFFKNFD